MKKNWKTVLQDIVDNILFGVLLAAMVLGIFFAGMFCIYLCVGPVGLNRITLILLMLASAALVFGILRYLGGDRKK